MADWAFLSGLFRTGPYRQTSAYAEVVFRVVYSLKSVSIPPISPAATPCTSARLRRSTALSLAHLATLGMASSLSLCENRFFYGGIAIRSTVHPAKPSNGEIWHIQSTALLLFSNI